MGLGNIEDKGTKLNRLSEEYKKNDIELRNLMKDQVTEMLEAPLKDVKDKIQSLQQELEKLMNCLGGLKSRLDIEEKRTTEGFKALNTRAESLDSKMNVIKGLIKDLKEPLTSVSLEEELTLRQYLKAGYKETRLQVPILPDCYTLPVSKIFAPAVILKENKSCLKPYGTLEQNKLDRDMHSKDEIPDQKVHSYKTIFYDNGVLQKRNFLLGKAGVGKTTFCKHLVDIWCNASQSPYYDDAGCLELFEFVFHVECRHAGEAESVFDMICNQLICKDSLKIVVKEVLNAKPDKCLVIADGVDEWKGSATQSAITSYDIPGLPSTKDLHNCVMLTTSRPWRIHALSQRLQQADRVFEIQGIEDVKTLTMTIITELQEADPEHTCQAFLQSVEACNMKELIQTPLMLINVLTMWLVRRSLNPSICVNYSCMVEAFVQRAKGESGRYEDTNRLTETTVTGLCRLESNWAKSAHLLPECFQSTFFCKLYADLLIRLGHLAFDLLVREKHERLLVFAKQETRNYLNERELKVCLILGILSQSQTPGRGIQKMDIFSFCHKTFQEFLGSLWLSINFSHICVKFYECCKTLDDVFDFNVFVQFLCGFCPHAGKIFWQYIANELLEKDEDIQKKRMKDIVARDLPLPDRFNSISKLDLLVLSCTEEAMHNSSYQQDQKVSFSMPDLHVVKEQMQTLFYNQWQEDLAKIRSVEVSGNDKISSQIVKSMKNMTKVVCICLCSTESVSMNDHPVLSMLSPDGEEMSVFPQQLKSLKLQKWKIETVWNDLPIQLKTLKFAELSMTHCLIEKLTLSIHKSLNLQYLNLTRLYCIDHDGHCCLSVLDLQRHHSLEALELKWLPVESLLLPGQQRKYLSRLVLTSLNLSEQSKVRLFMSLTSYHYLQEMKLSFSDSNDKKCLPLLDLQGNHMLGSLTIDTLTFKNILMPTGPPDACLLVLQLSSVTMSHQSCERLNKYLDSCLTLQELTFRRLSCIDHKNTCCLQAMDLQLHQQLKKIRMESLYVCGVLLPYQQESTPTDLALDNLTLSHRGKEQLYNSLAACSGLEALHLNTLSCIDHSDSCCMSVLDIQSNHTLYRLILEKLPVKNLLLPFQSEACLLSLTLNEIALTHNDREHLCSALAECSRLIYLDLDMLPCSVHCESCCLPVLDLQKHKRLMILRLKGLSVESLMLPLQPEAYLETLILDKITLTHHAKGQMYSSLAEYSELSSLNMNMLRCSDHNESCCSQVLDLQMHQRLTTLILKHVSVESVMLPVQPEACLSSLTLQEITLAHSARGQLCSSLTKCSGLSWLELSLLSCSDHNETCCLQVLDLQRHQQVKKLTLMRLSVESLMLPVQSNSCLESLELHEINLTHHAKQQFCSAVAECSKLTLLRLDLLSCSDHDASCCLPGLDLQKHKRLKILSLTSLSVERMMLPAQPKDCLETIILDNIILTHRVKEQVCSSLAECSRLSSLQIVMLLCSDHVEGCCLEVLDLHRHQQLTTLTLMNISVESMMLPVQPDSCLETLTLYKVNLNHDAREKLFSSIAECSKLLWLQLDLLPCSDHGESCCLQIMDLQRHRQLRSLSVMKLSVESVMLPIQQRQACLETLLLHGITLTHHDREQLCSCLAESSRLSLLVLETLSCRDHDVSCCLPGLDLQTHQRLHSLTLKRLSVERVVLPVHLDSCLSYIDLHELIMTHQDIEHLCIYLAEHSDLEGLELSTISCRDHGAECLIILDLQKLHNLWYLALARLSVKSVILPVQLKTCLRNMNLHELNLRHQATEQLYICLPEYSGLEVLELKTIFCKDDGQKCCLTILDLQKQRDLRNLTLARLSVESVLLPVQLKACIVSIKLQELNLTHKNIEQLCIRLTEYSGLEWLELNTISCSDHGDKCSLIVLDLQKKHCLMHLTLGRLDIADVLLPGQVGKILDIKMNIVNMLPKSWRSFIDRICDATFDLEVVLKACNIDRPAYADISTHSRLNVIQANDEIIITKKKINKYD